MSSAHVRLATATILSFAIVGTAFLFGIQRSNADTCPAGTVEITPTSRATATAAGIPSSVECWNPNDANAGTAAGSAKQWLQQHATKGSNIACENAQFAEKLEKFMQAVPGGTPTITSGYRDPSEQVALVKSGASHAGPCQSYHNYGLAADFNNNTKQQTAWMRANAAAYGLKTIGTWDPNHIEDNGGRHGQCGSCANAGGDGTISGGSPSDNTGTPDDVAPYTPPVGQQCAQGYVQMGTQCVMTPQSNPVPASMMPQSSNFQTPTTQPTTQTTPLTSTNTASSSTLALLSPSNTASPLDLLNSLNTNSNLTTTQGMSPSDILNTLNSPTAPTPQNSSAQAISLAAGTTDQIVTIVPGNTPDAAGTSQSGMTATQGGDTGSTFVSSNTQNASDASTIQQSTSMFQNILSELSTGLQSLISWTQTHF